MISCNVGFFDVKIKYTLRKVNVIPAVSSVDLPDSDGILGVTESLCYHNRFHSFTDIVILTVGLCVCVCVCVQVQKNS